SLDPYTGILSGTIQGTLFAGGVYLVTVVADDQNGGTSSQTFDWTVAPAGLSAQGLPVSFTEGNAADQTLATFTDGSTDSQAGAFTAIIAWGDGTNGFGEITCAAGSFGVVGSHVYAHPGSFAVSVTISDD